MPRTKYRAESGSGRPPSVPHIEVVEADEYGKKGEHRVSEQDLIIPAETTLNLHNAINELAGDNEKNRRAIEGMYSGNANLFRRGNVAIEGNQMQKIIWELTRQQFEAYTRANFDELTGLLRGNVFDGRVAKLAETSIGKKGGALVYIDLNDIKAMNAKYGHEQVNILLAEIGRVIDKSIRPYDSACRRGGDEFVICLSNLQKEDAGVNAVHRIFREIENINIEMKTAKGEVISIRPSLSMGVRAIKEEEMKTIGENLKSWIDETDAGVTALKHRQGHSKEGICIINQDGTSGSIHEYNATDKGFRVAEDVKLEEAANPEAVLEKTIRRALTLIVEPCIRKETGLAPAPIEETIKKLANDIRTNCY